MSRRSAVWVMLLVVFSACLASGEETAKPGKLVPRISLGEGRSYALYLPSNYSEQQKWPVVFVFDPMARGAAAAERFVQGAEKYGYIVAASNDSRNGPVQVKAIEAMIAAVRSGFSVDPRRVYLSGMSGGARVAIMYANKCNECAGVIACAAGYGYEKDFRPEHLSFFAIAGLYDFNYPEMYHEAEELDGVKARHRFEVFDGDHGWPPAENLTEAMAWLRLQEMARGMTARDPEWIAARYGREMERGRALQAESQSYRAYLLYKQAVSDYAGLLDASEARKSMEALAKSAAVKQGLATEKKRIELQRGFEKEILRVVYSSQEGPLDAAALQSARSQTVALVQAFKREKNLDRSIAYRRALGGIRIAALSSAQVARERHDESGASGLEEIAKETR